MVTKKPEITFETLFPGKERPPKGRIPITPEIFQAKGEEIAKTIPHIHRGKSYEADRCDDKDVIVMTGVTYYAGEADEVKKKNRKLVSEKPIKFI